MSADLSAERFRLMHLLVANGYLSSIEALIKSLCAPFVWWEEKSPTEKKIRGGTICFVDTGSKLIGITAAHVHKEYIEKYSENRDIHCQIGGHTFTPQTRIRNIDNALDIAIYDISKIQVSAARANIHYAPIWPPRVKENDICIIGGWLWDLTSESPSAYHPEFLHFIGKISSSTPKEIGIVTSKSTSISWQNITLPPGVNLGGMSGGPIFVVNEKGLTQLELVGIVYEYGVDFEIHLGRPLSLINKEGLISGLSI